MMGKDLPIPTPPTATIRAAKESETERLHEIAALSSRDDSVGATRLVEFLADPSWRVRRAAADALVGSASRELVFQAVLDAFRNGHRKLGLLNALLGVLDRLDLDVVPALEEFLLDPDADLRIYAAQALGERADPAAVPALLRTLADPNENVRCQAIETLGKLRSSGATDALIAIAETREFAAAFAALDALASIGDGRIGPRLFPLLQDGLLAEATIRVLGRLGDEEAIPHLTALLDVELPPAMTVARALVEIHDRYQSSYSRGGYIAELVRRLLKPPAIQVLIAAAGNAQSDEAPFMARMLSWLPGDQVVDALIILLALPHGTRAATDALVRKGTAAVGSVAGLLENSDRTLVRAAVEVLGRIGAPAPFPALIGLLAEDDLAAAAAGALAMIGDIRAYPAVSLLLGHPRANVRQAAVAAVNSIAHPNRASDLARWLRDRSPLVRESAVKIACYLGIPEEPDLILACCDDENEQVRKTAIENIGLLDGERIPAIIASALRSGTPAVRAAAAQAFAGGTEFESSQLLIEALADPDVWVRYYAAKKLSVLLAPSDNSLQALSRLAQQDTAMQVRIACIEGLGHGSALPLLIALAADADSDIAQAALKSLGASRHSGALPILLATLDSEDSGKRKVAVEALGKSGLSAAVEPLCRILRDEDRDLVATAIDALGRLDCVEGVAALVDFLQSPRWRETCIMILARMAPRRMDWVAKGLNHQNPDVRRGIVEVLAFMSESVAVQMLRGAVSDTNPAVRYAALAALAHKGAYG
jgi:HEAT repeat protein